MYPNNLALEERGGDETLTEEASVGESLSQEGAKSNLYDITKIENKNTDDKVQQCKAAEIGVLPTHPFRWYIVGASGSGKSNLLMNILTKPQFYAGYFDSIEIMSPTALHLDPIYQAIDLPEDHFFGLDPDVLAILLEQQKKEVKEKGKVAAPKVLLVLDDFISDQKFAHSKELLQFAVMSRHYNISMILLSQAYHRVAKSIRLNMNVISYFKGSNPESITLGEDFGAPGLTRQQFQNVIAYATDEPYSFFFINMKEPVNDGRYRKNFCEILI